MRLRRETDFVRLLRAADTSVLRASGRLGTVWPGVDKFGVNYGGGLKVRVSEKFLVRVDWRQYLTGKPFGGSEGLPVSGSVKQNVISAGVGFIL